MAKKRITSLQLEILQEWANGLKNKEIAEKLECSVEAVVKAKADPDIKKMFYEKQNEQIEELLPLAVKTLGDLLKNPKTMATVKIAAIREVFDRSHLKELLADDEKDHNINLNIKYE